MDELIRIVLASWLAGIAAFAGAVLAKFEGSAETEGKREIIHGIVAFGGGILYLVFQNIAPQARMRRHWTPPLGAVLGFAVGLLGEQLLG